MTYSAKVHCSSCGNLFPKSITVIFPAGKAVLRLCMPCYEPKRVAEEARIVNAIRERTAQVEEVKQRVKER